MLLKGTVARDFYLWFFSWIHLIWAPDSHPKIFSNSDSNSGRYLYSKVKIRESALLDTALIPNQCCQIQRWFWISVVGYSANSSSVLYPTALNASKEKLLDKNIPLKTDISVVGYSTHSESALYHTALIPNQRCRIHRWFRISAVWYSADSWIQRWFDF